MRPRWAVLLLATTFLVACSPTTEGQPESSPPPPPSSTATALAPIDGFPDTSNYIKSNRRDYLEVSPKSPALHFLTPDGMSCFLGAVPTAEQAYASCMGLRPDQGQGDWKVSVNRGETGIVEHAPPPPNPNYIAPTPRALPPMHVLTYGADQLCAVDDKGMTACRVGDHGFILTPTSTKLF